MGQCDGGIMAHLYDDLRAVKGVHKTYHCGGGIVYHRRDERGPYGTWSGDCLVVREDSSGVS